MKSESEFLLELVDIIYSRGIGEGVCQFIHNETGIASGRSLERLKINLSEGAIELCNDIHCMYIGEIAMGYRITQKDNENMIDAITDHILIF